MTRAEQTAFRVHDGDLHQLAGREDAGSELAANVARVLDTLTA